MADGRTTWWPCDAAEHDRELIVELGEEFGPGGPLLMRVLKDLAQQQRDPDGAVKTGVRSLRQKCFLADVDEVRAIISHAAEIGAIDSLEIDPDGRRFTCRVSGWRKDQERGRAAWRKADQRRRDAGDSDEQRDSRGLVTPERDTSRSVTQSHEKSTTRPNQTKEEPEETTSLEHSDFADWLIHHNQTTGQTTPRDGTKARAKIAAMYRARRAEGYGAADLCLATAGAYNDPYRREHGHYGCESVLRPEKVHDLIEKGRRSPVAATRVSMHPADVRDRELAAMADRLRQEEGAA